MKPEFSEQKVKSKKWHIKQLIKSFNFVFNLKRAERERKRETCKFYA